MKKKLFRVRVINAGLTARFRSICYIIRDIKRVITVATKGFETQAICNRCDEDTEHLRLMTVKRIQEAIRVVTGLTRILETPTE